MLVFLCRYNTFVVQTAASNTPEIQFIKTVAQPGQTLAGGFTLHFKGHGTFIIPHDASSLLMKQIIEGNLNLSPPQNSPVDMNRLTGVAGVGLVNVSRSLQDDEEGYTWLVTFTTAVGNIPQMTSTSFLQGLQAAVSTGTTRDGNEIEGSFQLEFQGMSTVAIAAYETAAGFTNKLL